MHWLQSSDSSALLAVHKFCSREHHPPAQDVQWFVAKRLSKSSTVPKHLREGLVIGIKSVTFTLLPCGFQCGLCDVPVRAALPQHSTQVLPKLFDGRSAKKPVAVIDLEYNETWFEDDDIRDHRIVFRVRVLGNIEVLLNLASRIG